MLAVIQNGPRRERLYLCRMSFQPSSIQSRHNRKPDATSARAQDTKSLPAPLVVAPGANGVSELLARTIVTLQAIAHVASTACFASHIVAALILETDQSANTSNPTPKLGLFHVPEAPNDSRGAVNFEAAIRSRDGVDSE
jgi:hypothetical protein